MCICLNIYLYFIFISIYLSIYVSFYLSFYLSIYLSTFLSIFFFYLTIFLSTYQYINVSFYPSFICLSIYLLSIYLGWRDVYTAAYPALAQRSCILGPESEGSCACHWATSRDTCSKSKVGNFIFMFRSLNDKMSYSISAN